MNTVSYLTINEETRKIVDEKSHDDIELLKAQIEYIAQQLEIDLSEVTVNKN